MTLDPAAVPHTDHMSDGSETTWRYLGPLTEFDLITRCARHGEPRAAGAPICAHAPGVEIASVPLFCELAAGHEGRHVHTNGGHACWEVDSDGRAHGMVVRDFTIRAPGCQGRHLHSVDDPGGDA